MKKSLFILFAILALAIPQKALAGWSDYVIILDPGHGGPDCGATYDGGALGQHAYESWLVMNCAANVYNKLVARGAHVYPTRELDNDDIPEEVELSPRRAYCYTYNSDIFVSFHLNAANGIAYGTETYYSSDYSSNSYSLAATMQNALLYGDYGFKNVNKRGGYILNDRYVKTANYSVIIAGEYYPSILTEGLFIDTYTDWQLIQSADTSDPGFSAWVDGHLNGIYNYLKDGYMDEAGLYYNGTGSSTVGTISWSPNNNATNDCVDLTCEVGKSVTYTVTLDGSNLNYWTTATLSEAAKNIGISISQEGFAVDGSTHTFNPEKPTITITFTPKQVGTWKGWTDDTYGFQSNYFIHIKCPADVSGNVVERWINFQCYATEPTAAITPSVADLNLSCRLGESVTETITLYGAGLTSDVTVSAANASTYGVTVSPATLAVDTETGTFAEGNTVTITYTPTVAGTETIAKGITFSGSSVNGDLTSSLNLTCTAEAPAITLASRTLNLACPEGQSITRTIALDGFGLTGNATATLSDAAKAIGITMTDENGTADANGNVVLGVADNAFSPAKPKLKLVFKPTASFDANSDQYYITVSAPCLGAAGSKAETKITLKPSVTTFELPLVEAWNKSEKLGTDIVTGTYFSKPYTYDAKKIRNMEYYKDRLFCVYDQERIRVLSARDNARLLYDLSNEGVSGGAVALADVKEFDGKIIACNIITSESTDKTLKIYIWDKVLNYDQSNNAPQVVSIKVSNLFETDEINRIGDYIECDGTWESGRIILSALERLDNLNYPMIYQYAVNDGVISTTKLDEAVEPITSTGEYLTCGNSLRATPTSYGFMINAAGILPAKVHYNHSPYANGLIADQMMNYEKWGNTYRQFEYNPDGTEKGTNTYALMLDYASPEYDSNNNIVNGTAYRGGHMKLFRIINGTQGSARDWEVTFTQPTQVGMFPYEGLSDVNQNVNSTGNICVNTDGNSYLEAWILCTNQGIAFYRLGTQQPTGVEGTFSDEEVEKEVKSVEYVNMMGQRSLKPFEGVNIVVTTFTDGTTKATKTMK